MDIKLSYSRTGKRLLIVNKYKFFNSYVTKNNLVTWRCVRKSCHAKAQTYGESEHYIENRKLNTVHNHDPQSEEVLKRNLITHFCKQKAKEVFMERPAKIINSELIAQVQGSSSSTSNSGITSRDKGLIRRCMYRARVRQRLIVSKSRALVHKELTTMSITTNLGEHFLFENDAANGIIIFATPTNLDYLRRLHTIFFDGTLNYCVKHFTQLYIIYGILNGTCIPLVYSLLPDKTFNTYNILLKKLEAVGMRPALVYVDFESAMHEAIISVLPQTVIYGCRFHLSQIWFCKIKQLELEPEFNKPEEEIGKYLTFILYGLPFLKSEAIVESFAQFYAAIKPNDQRVNSFWEYIVENYIDKNGKFPPRVWATDTPDIHSITSACEAFQAEFNQYFDESEPDIHKFLTALKQLQDSTYAKMNSANTTTIKIENIEVSSQKRPVAIDRRSTTSTTPTYQFAGSKPIETPESPTELSPFEVYLEPSARELMEALRALFIQTHWHSFTILADDSVASSVLLRRDLVNILKEPPLRPTIVRLPAINQPHALFRRLADISRSTRGIVILMCDRGTAGRVLDEARRLNMVDGHFVWLWIDTEPANLSPDSGDGGGVTTDKPPPTSNNKQRERESRNRRGIPSTPTTMPTPVLQSPTVPTTMAREEALRRHRELVKSDISDMHVEYLLKNDQYLMFNRDRDELLLAKSKQNSGAARKFRDKRPPPSPQLSTMETPSSASRMELPVGLLSIRAVPMKVDKHVVRGAVRLLVGTLRAALARCPPWLAQSIALDHLETSCWAPASATEFNFSTVFARELRAQCTDALAGKKLLQENGIEKVDKSLVSNFEISNLVPEFPVDGEPTDATKTGFSSGSGNPEGSSPQKLKWRTVGHVTGRTVHLDTIVWPGGGVVVAGLSSQARSVFRVVTALAPPFVMESGLDEDGQCLRGLPCHRVLTSDKDNLTLVFNDMETQDRLDDNDDVFGENYSSTNEEKYLPLPLQRYRYQTNCCYGLAMDLLENVAHELQFDFRLYIVADGLFGTRTASTSTGTSTSGSGDTNDKRNRRDVGKAYLNYRRHDVIFRGASTEHSFEEDMDPEPENAKWNGVVGDLVTGAAHMSFAALSVSSARSEVIDYSTPFFYSGVSFLAAPQQKSEIPLMAFLLPFSPELWIAIFTSLNITAIAVAVYEWLSPFGLNPWGRQRSKNFSMSSALWVMWGLLCGHLVAFKAPKSWPNKFLINVWGGFSVIFVASYTANIAALIAGLFFQNTVSNYHDRSLLSQKVGAPRASAAEYYVKRANKLLWDHMHPYTLDSVEDGIERLRNGSLDILIADTPILDYYRATDHGCTLQKIGDSINEDTYAVGMTKGFPLKDSISAVIAKYAANGYMDILQEKWYGGLPCFKLVTEIAQPRPLGVAAVTGVFILLGVGMFLGCLILLVEHLFYRYTLPILRHKPKGTIWRSRNIMFFSQKLYRFINCVELVSPHHAARELVHTLRQGQITSLFQKSVKRKEHEQRRRRKSKAQFFEMIQEIRRQQQEVRQQPPLASLTEVDQEYQNSPEEKRDRLSPNIIRRTFMRSSPKMDTPTKSKSPTPGFGSLFSPRSKAKARSQTALNVRRFSTDSVFNSQTLKLDRSNAIGRRLSKDVTFLSSSPPDINSRRSSYLDMINSSSKLSGKSPVLSIENVSECESIGKKFSDHKRKFSDAENIGRKLATLPKNFNTNQLHPNDRLNMGKSEETLTKPENASNYGTMRANEIITAKSYQNIPDSSKRELEVETSTGTSSGSSFKKNVTDDEIAKRNKLTIDQLKIQLSKTDTGKPLVTRSQSNNVTPMPAPIANPSIRIQVEDTSNNNGTSNINSTSTSKSRSMDRRVKHRHRSLGEAPPPPTKSPLPPEPSRRNLRGSEQSKSLDGNPNAVVAPSSSRSRPKCREHDLPPAPPPPNCSPRNSNGRSPLERLSKDELVNLWRSSESELRSHLLKAIRDKDTDDPP